MRLDELKINEEDVARKYLIEKYPHLTEEQLDEFVQAILPALATAGRVGLKLGTQALKTGGKLAYQGAKALGKGALNVGKQLGKGALNVGKDLAVSGAEKLYNKMQGNDDNTTARSGGVQSNANDPDTKKIQQAKLTQLKATKLQGKKNFQAVKQQHNQEDRELDKQIQQVMK